MQKHLLIIGGVKEIPTMAKTLGLKLSLMLSADKITLHDDLHIYDRIVALPTGANIDEWLNHARLIHENDPIHAIGSFNETVEFQASAIGKLLALPCHSADLVNLTHNKFLMRRHLAADGLDATPSMIATLPLEDSIRDFARSFGFPLIVKPLDARGSLGVSCIRDESDIVRAIHWFGAHAQGHTMLIEKFLAGPEWSVEAFSENGQHKIICITEKFKDGEHFVETGHCVPAALPQELAERISTYVISVLSSLGFQHGPSHTEIILTESGPQVVETHTRTGGGMIVNLIENVSGSNIYALWLSQVLGESVISKVPTLDARGKFSAIMFLSSTRDGILRDVIGIDAAKTDNLVNQVEILQPLGSTVTMATSSIARCAFVIATADSRSAVLKTLTAASEKLELVVA